MTARKVLLLMGVCGYVISLVLAWRVVAMEQRVDRLVNNPQDLVVRVDVRVTPAPRADRSRQLGHGRQPAREVKRAPIAPTPVPRALPTRQPSGLDWPALAECESGGDPTAVSPTGRFRGLYQFDLETWQGVGGTGDPAAASASEQTRRAQRLYDQRGSQPWPECGKHLR